MVDIKELQQQACGFIAKALGIKDPKIEWTKEVRPEWNSVTNTIYLPLIPLESSKEDVDRYLTLLKGWVDHESGHSRYSDHGMKRPKLDDDVLFLANFLEDCRVDREMSKMFPGTEYNIREGYKLTFNEIREAVEKMPNAPKNKENK